MKRSEYFALRINHFLKGYRKKNNLTQSELATRIKTTKSTVSRIENGQDKQIIEVLSMLERLGQLEGMDLVAFFSYLDAQQNESKPINLFPWQISTLNVLGQIKQSVRLDLVAEFLSQDPLQVEKLLAILLRLNRLPKASQELIERLVTEMKS